MIGADNLPNVSLTGLQRLQSVVAVAGDGENSLSMRWGKFDARGAMYQACGGGVGSED